ncbi:unnamed protein product [Staurois parvus]|uniref:Uncharacterized protein n=1 Tax=Staurois parvus TaxID=386267 RepID=A0ABN9ET83_9NEOB|nr:unnamed protein product [Staurois parvus]
MPVTWEEVTSPTILGNQGRTDNSWGPRAIGDHGAPVSSPKPKKAYEKANERYQGHLMGPPTEPGPSGSARVLKWSVHP